MKHFLGIIFLSLTSMATAQNLKLTHGEVIFLLSVFNPPTNSSSFMIQGGEVDMVIEIRAALRTLAAQADSTKKEFYLPLTPLQRNLCLRAVNESRFPVAFAEAIKEFKKKLEPPATNGKAK